MPAAQAAVLWLAFPLLNAGRVWVHDAQKVFLQLRGYLVQRALVLQSTAATFCDETVTFKQTLWTFDKARDTGETESVARLLLQSGLDPGLRMYSAKGHTDVYACIRSCQ